MQYEVSCGAIVFTRRQGEILYVIVQSREGYYGFPKGHMEPGETEEETARREIFEEVGLRPRLLEGFKTFEEHPLPRKPGVMKRVIYFLAEYADQEIVYQKEELMDARLMSYEEAIGAFQFDSARRNLTEANDFLKAL